MSISFDTNLPACHIVGFKDLFLDGPGNTPTLPCGSTMMLSGPPGAGKTTFALALVRSMLLHAPPAPAHARDAAVPPGGQSPAGDATPLHTVYYVSPEVTRERLHRMFGSRGWFGDKDQLFRPNPSTSRSSGLHVINPPLEIERPVKSSEELVNYIIRHISVQSPPKQGQFVFIIVDSITALFKDSRHPGEARRQVHELIHRLRGLFPAAPAGSDTGALGMIILLAEQSVENLETPGLETYVADFVFKLGFKALSMGTRLRTLEVTKSQGANLLMGTHTWIIVSDDSLSRLIAGQALRDKVLEMVDKTEGPKGRQLRQEEQSGHAPSQNPPQADSAGRLEPAEATKPEPPRWCTLIIARMPYFNTLEPSLPVPAIGEPSGIWGLDQMLKSDPDFWFQNPEARPADHDKVWRRAGAIKPGSVTILVGAAGTGKTSLCFHTIAKHLALHRKSGDESKALLIGFEQDFRSEFLNFTERFPISVEGSKLTAEDCERCEQIFRPRSALHINLFLLELRAWLEKHGKVPRRIAIDGISNLEATQSPQHFSKLLDAIIFLLSEHPGESGQKPSLFLTYETPQSESILESDAFRLPAANIVMLAPKAIEDERRTAVTVIKSSYQHYDSMVRELVLDHAQPGKTHIRSGFDAYTGLLTPQPQPARVVLQLFCENERELDYNRALFLHLQSILPYEFSLRDFSRFEISTTLKGTGDSIKVPSGDVQIVNMDEWWLSHKVQQLVRAAGASEADENDAGGRPPAFRDIEWKNHLTNLAGIVSETAETPISPGDFWCSEMEKAWNPDRHIGPYALPSFLDFGMLCINRESCDGQAPHCSLNRLRAKDMDHVPWEGLDPVSPERQRFAQLLSTYMVPWCVPEPTANGLEWFRTPDARNPVCLVDFMKAKAQSGAVPHGFAWDSRTPETAACFFYELAWCFGGDSGLFVLPAKRRNERAIVRALSFIGFLVRQKLMPPCPTLTDTVQAVFSRHFYSTFTDVSFRTRRQPADLQTPVCSHQQDADTLKSHEPILVALGFMPPGPEAWQREALDHRQRLERLQARFETLVRNRNTRTTGTQDTAPPGNVETCWTRAAAKFQEGDFLLSPNPTDIAEMLRWNSLRQEMTAVGSWHTILKTKPAALPGEKPRAGYGCCGAWMIGVKSPTASPGLAQVVLQEMTSLSFAKKRARMGAGLPARQDFYHYYGDRPVTGMEYIDWNEMLKFLAGRGRRRDRVYGQDGVVDPANMHKLIHHAVTQIMRMAVEATPAVIIKRAETFAAAMWSTVSAAQP